MSSEKDSKNQVEPLQPEGLFQEEANSRGNQENSRDEALKSEETFLLIRP